MLPRLILEALLIRELIVLSGEGRARLVGDTRSFGGHDALVELEGFGH